MKKSEKVKLTDLLTQLFQLRELTASQELQMDAIWESIEAIAEANPKEFIDGQWVIDGVGLMKYVQKPAKLVYSASGKGLNDVETAGIVTELEEIGVGFRKIALNMTKLKNLVEAKNGAVLTLLTKNGLELIQGTRLDIKKIS